MYSSGARHALASFEVPTVEAIEFISARDAEAGLNVALFSPAALADRAPTQRSRWICRVLPSGVSFIRQGKPSRLVSFDLSEFLIDGRLPRPA